MSTTTLAAIETFFEGFTRADGALLARAFAEGGTYEDPTTGGPVDAHRAAVEAARWRSAFPDLTLEREPPLWMGERASVCWRLRGHNEGAYGPGIAPTGRLASVAGVTVFEGGPQGLRAARAYFDERSLVASFGLMSLVQPVEQGPARYGYSMRVPSGNPRPPGVIALTWIEGADEAEKERIRAHSRANVQDFLREPGFVSIVTGFTGLRGFTVTAWEDEASLRRALSKHHAVAMGELFGERFVASVWTSVWQPTRLNRLWLRCPACGALEDASDDHRTCSRCATPLPPRPAFW